MTPYEVGFTFGRILGYFIILGLGIWTAKVVYDNLKKKKEETEINEIKEAVTDEQIVNQAVENITEVLSEKKSIDKICGLCKKVIGTDKYTKKGPLFMHKTCWREQEKRLKREGKMF